MYKVIPNLFMVLLLVPLFSLSNALTKNTWAALLSVVLAGSAPIVFGSYLNTPSPIPIALTVFLTILSMIQRPKSHLPWIVGLTLFLTFLSPTIFVLVLVFLMSILLLKMEGFGVDKRMNELFFFSLFLAVWFHVLVYKRALFSEGLRVIWQNLPAKYAALQFGTVTFFDLIYGLGVVTFLFGVFGTYYTLFETRDKTAYNVVAAELVIIIMLFTRVIELRLGLLFLSLLMAVMASQGILTVFSYLKRTKFPAIRYPLALFTILLFLLTAVLPALTGAKETLQNAPSQNDLETYRLLSQMPKGAVLLTTVREGAAVQYYTRHTTVTDDDFLMVRNSGELVRDIDDVYKARFAVSLPGKAEKLGFTHILFSENAARQYGRDRLLIDEHGCIAEQRFGTSLVYRILCGGEQ